MSYIIPNGFARITITNHPVSLLGSNPTWGFGVAAAPSSDVLDAVQLWVEDHLADFTSASAQIKTISMFSDAERLDREIDLPGNDSAEFAPPQVAALVVMRTGLTGKANRGRFYLPSVVRDEDVGSDGKLTTTKHDDLSALIEDLGTAILSVDAPPVILHSTSSDPTAVTETIVQGTIATQRRRVRT